MLWPSRASSLLSETDATDAKVASALSGCVADAVNLIAAMTCAAPSCSSSSLSFRPYQWMMMRQTQTIHRAITRASAAYVTTSSSLQSASAAPQLT